MPVPGSYEVDPQIAAREINAAFYEGEGVLEVSMNDVVFAEWAGIEKVHARAALVVLLGKIGELLPIEWES